MLTQATTNPGLTLTQDLISNSPPYILPCNSFFVSRENLLFD